jgi:lipopolysaccharide transport system ATP-binding protein
MFDGASANPIVGMLIRNRLGVDVFGTNTRLEQQALGNFEPGDELEISFRFRCLLTRQEYTLTVATQNADGTSQDWRDDALQFTVVDEKDVAGLASLKTDIHWTVHRRTGLATR